MLVVLAATATAAAVVILSGESCKLVVECCAETVGWCTGTGVAVCIVGEIVDAGWYIEEAVTGGGGTRS